MATLPTSSAGTGWPTSSKIACPHKKNYRSLITFLRYNRTVTLADLYPRALAACLARDPEFLAFFRDPDNRVRIPDVGRSPAA